LILGGTAEARALAEAALARFGQTLRVTTSLAGRTSHNAILPGDVRRGGFGGAEGLAAFLQAAAVDLVIDATHPFAAKISAAAAAACRSSNVPRLVLQRPPWVRDAGDRWIEVADAAAAAAHIAALRAARVLLTIGHRDITAFANLRDAHFIVRLIEPPAKPLPLPSHEMIFGRGPFTAEAEGRMMRNHAVEAVVTKASGGRATAGKLAAARALHLPVVMLRRPPPQSGESADTIDAALDWIARWLVVSKEAVP